MPIARHPSPEDVDCLLRNAELRDQIEPYLDESIHEIDLSAMPTSVENRFLESMLAWERAPLVPVAQWFDPPLVLPSASLMDDAEVRERLWEVIERLFSKRVVLDFADHLDDRSLYGLIRRDILPAAIKQVDLPDNYFRWDCSACDGDDPTTWLIYYASDFEREQWAIESGGELPPRAVPPYPRALPVAPV
jgi:hypothetical protein